MTTLVVANDKGGVGKDLIAEGFYLAALRAKLAPQLFESLRLYLQASPEQRVLDRWTFTAPLRVYPVLPDLELAPTLEGVCCDLSPGGVRFRLSERPPVDQLYLHLYNTPAALGFAVLAQVARVTEAEDGVEIGARFTPECRSEQ